MKTITATATTIESDVQRFNLLGNDEKYRIARKTENAIRNDCRKVNEWEKENAMNACKNSDLHIDSVFSTNRTFGYSRYSIKSEVLENGDFHLTLSNDPHKLSPIEMFSALKKQGQTTVDLVQIGFSLLSLIQVENSTFPSEMPVLSVKEMKTKLSRFGKVNSTTVRHMAEMLSVSYVTDENRNANIVITENAVLTALQKAFDLDSMNSVKYGK